MRWNSILKFCIFFRYTLLIGRPPFETSTLRDTYHKIKRGEYVFPQTIRISDFAKKLLCKCLLVDPDLRPSAKVILASEFMTHGKRTWKTLNLCSLLITN